MWQNQYIPNGIEKTIEFLTKTFKKMEKVQEFFTKILPEKKFADKKRND